MIPPGFAAILNTLKREMESRPLREIKMLRLFLSIGWHFTEDQRYETLQTLLALEDLKRLPEIKKINDEFDGIMRGFEK